MCIVLCSERNVINTYLDAYEIFMLNLLISAFPSPTHITDFPNRKAHYGAIVPMIVRSNAMYRQNTESMFCTSSI